MISTPRYSSFWAGFMSDEWINMDLVWIEYLSPAFIILPAFANSALTLLHPAVLLAVVRATDGLAYETWRGRHNSDSDAYIRLSHTVSLMAWTRGAFSGDVDVRLSLQFQNRAITIKGSRYVNHLFILLTNLDNFMTTAIQTHIEIKNLTWWLNYEKNL